MNAFKNGFYTIEERKTREAMRLQLKLAKSNLKEVNEMLGFS